MEVEVEVDASDLMAHAEAVEEASLRAAAVADASDAVTKAPAAAAAEVAAAGEAAASSSSPGGAGAELAATEAESDGETGEAADVLIERAREFLVRAEMGLERDRKREKSAVQQLRRESKRWSFGLDEDMNATTQATKWLEQLGSPGSSAVTDRLDLVRQAKAALEAYTACYQELTRCRAASSKALAVKNATLRAARAADARCAAAPRETPLARNTARLMHLSPARITGCAFAHDPLWPQCRG